MDTSSVPQVVSSEGSQLNPDRDTVVDCHIALGDGHHTQVVVETMTSERSAINPQRHSLDDEHGQASSLSSVFTLCNSAIGAGVLSLPYAFKCAGALGGLLLCVGMAVLEGCTLYFAAKFAERYGTKSYGQLVHASLGRKLSAALSIILVLFSWGSCIAYMIIIGDNFSSLLSIFVDPESALVDRRVVMSGMALAVVLPLCFPRRLDALHWVSAAAVAGFLYTALVVVMGGVQIAWQREPGHRFEDIRLFQSSNSVLFAVPIIVFGFNCHANIVTIFRELEHRPNVVVPALPSRPSDYAAMTSALAPRPKTHKLIGMLGVIIAAMQIILCGYLAVGFAGYVAFPFKVSSNVLNSFPQDALLIQVARAVVGCVVVGHYPIYHHPARLAVQDMCVQWLGLRSLSRTSSVFFTLTYVASTCAVAMMVDDLGTVLHMIGGTAAAFMNFFVPGLMMVNAGIMKHSAEVVISESEPSTPASSRSPSHNKMPSDMEFSDPARMALLMDASVRGVKSTKAISFAPRKSWWIGMFLMAMSVVIFTITIWTAFTV